MKVFNNCTLLSINLEVFGNRHFKLAPKTEDSLICPTHSNKVADTSPPLFKDADIKLYIYLNMRELLSCDIAAVKLSAWLTHLSADVILTKLNTTTTLSSGRMVKWHVKYETKTKNKSVSQHTDSEDIMTEIYTKRKHLTLVMVQAWETCMIRCITNK